MSRSYKDVVEHSHVRFNNDELIKLPTESHKAYISRILAIYKRTTMTHSYPTYKLTARQHSYTVVARHPIIAHLLCQIDADNKSNSRLASKYEVFRARVMEDMHHDEELYDTIMGHVHGDIEKVEDAICIHYNKYTDIKPIPIINWFDATCTIIPDTQGPLEKIIKIE